MASVVLAVDEDPAVRKLVRRMLQSAGLGCVEAADGESGLKLAVAAGVSVAVVDLVLPGMSGAELAWRLREGIPGLPVVAISGRLDLWDTDDLRDLGIREVLPKPFEPQKLVRAVADALAHSRSSRRPAADVWQGGCLCLAGGFAPPHPPSVRPTVYAGFRPLDRRSRRIAEPIPTGGKRLGTAAAGRAETARRSGPY